MVKWMNDISTKQHGNLQGDTAKDTKALPLEEQRAPNGHLFCHDVAEVPEKAVLPVKYPVHLGSLKLPLSVRITS